MSSLIQILDRPIAYNPALAKLRAGKVKAGPVAAVFLSQMIYWHNRMGGEWMYKTQADITTETALTRDEQETARKRLVALGVLDEARRGVPATLHYRINVARLEALLLEAATPGATPAPTAKTRTRDIQNSEPSQPGPAHSEQSRMVQSQNVETPQSRSVHFHNLETPQSRSVQSPQQVCGDPANFHTGDYTENTQENKKPSCPDAAQPDEPDSDHDFLSRHPEAVVFSAKKRLWGRQEDLTCAEWIWGRIVRLYELAAEDDGEVVRPKAPNWTVWANEVRLMCHQDGRTHRQICELFGRVNRDPFWCRNVLSPAKLREKWDELVIRLGAPGAGVQDRSLKTLLGADWNTEQGWENVL
ncbi:primosomal protein I [Edwardsiella tarda]|uniref:primosomal protein I n=1 Tax=Edwardsiella tarda TaxID=636 RepID=UPI00351C7C61